MYRQVSYIKAVGLLYNKKSGLLWLAETADKYLEICVCAYTLVVEQTRHSVLVSEKSKAMHHGFAEISYLHWIDQARTPFSAKTSYLTF